MTDIILKDYQQQIVDELGMFPASANFSRTGAGKTFMALFTAKEHPTNNLLIICPPSVTAQWASNVKIVSPELSLLEFKKSWSGNRQNEEILKVTGEHNLVIVSLTMLSKLTNLNKILNNNWTIILDESHKIKAVGTKKKPVQVTKAALALSHHTMYKMILSATPAQGNFGGYIDYYSQLKFLGFLDGMTERDFRNKYCIEDTRPIPGTPYSRKVITGYRENIDEIKTLIAAFSRSYTPSYTDDEPVHQKINIDSTPGYKFLVRERAYKELALESPSAYRITKKGVTSGRVSGYDMYGEPKLYQDNTKKIDWLKDYLTDNSETVIIFYQYNVEGDQIKELCEKLGKKYIKLDGSNNNKREDIDSEGYEVVIGQINACGESIDGLQYRSYIAIYYSLPESSTAYIQSLGRIYRMGQTIAPVYYYLVMEGTIDSAIYDLIEQKVEYTEEFIDQLSV